MLDHGFVFFVREKLAGGLLLSRLLLIFLLEDPSLFPVVFNDKLGSGVGDSKLFGCLVDGVVFELNHLDESESFLDSGWLTLKVILEYCILGFAYSSLSMPCINTYKKYSYEANTRGD